MFFVLQRLPSGPHHKVESDSTFDGRSQDFMYVNCRRISSVKRIFLLILRISQSRTFLIFNAANTWFLAGDRFKKICQVQKKQV